MPFACSQAVCSVKASDSYLWFYLARISAMPASKRIRHPLSLSPFLPACICHSVPRWQGQIERAKWREVWHSEQIRVSPVRRPPARHPSWLPRQPPVGQDNATHTGSGGESGSHMEARSHRTTRERLIFQSWYWLIKLSCHRRPFKCQNEVFRDPTEHIPYWVGVRKSLRCDIFLPAFNRHLCNKWQMTAATGNAST